MAFASKAVFSTSPEAVSRTAATSRSDVSFFSAMIAVSAPLSKTIGLVICLVYRTFWCFEGQLVTWKERKEMEKLGTTKQTIVSEYDKIRS